MQLTQPSILSRPFATFKCNRPFLFFIHDNQTHMILFFGKFEGTD
jgi:serine protease inhibitor